MNDARINLIFFFKEHEDKALSIAFLTTIVVNLCGATDLLEGTHFLDSWNNF